MIRGVILTAALLTVAAGASAQTREVDAARAAGQVGERYDGYIGISGAASGVVRSQVATINIRRRALYTNLAASRGASPQDVGVTAGCQLLARTGVGQSYMLGDGAWRRREPGQRAPVPDYCR